MGVPEVKVLRDEMARLIAMIKKQEHAIAELTSVVGDLRAENAALRADVAEERMCADRAEKESAELRARLESSEGQLRERGVRLEYYENSNAPASSGSLPAHKRQNENHGVQGRGKRAAHTGPQKGQGRVAHARKPDEVVEDKPHECANCGNSTGMEQVKSHHKTVTDIPSMLGRDNPAK